MINRLRRKFILVCAVSIFAVVILVFCGIAVLNVSSMNKTLDTLTDSLSEGKGRFPDSFGDRFSVHDSRPQKPDMDFITPETRYPPLYRLDRRKRRCDPFQYRFYTFHH